MPTDDRWARADAVFEAALDLPAEERSGFLRRECKGDDELLALVERLLSHAESPGDSFMTPGSAPGGPLLGAETTAEGRPDEGSDLSGTVIGRYRLVDVLGRGGMAVVYRAERADGEFEQQVALKLIRRGIDTDDVVRRFARERQILARIQHPHIARLIDGGTSADGRPFLVMELVEGEPVDRYCDTQKLSIGKRLSLFLEVADAVAHAHRKLVVHRDIKPSNILVDSRGAVKLLDFGIARLLGPESGDEQLTRTRQRLLTPAFASPEQIRGEPVTTSSDVYQLGVLLYLMLTGGLPYGGVEPGSHRFAQAILEDEPTRPSSFSRPVLSDGDADSATTLEEIGRRRGMTATALRRALAGDLDTILLTALRKEPDRRYGSVVELIEDVRRHLSGRPVSARADTFGYRTSKFVRRNRLAVAVTAVAVVTLIGFVVTLGVQARRIARERDHAGVEAATAQRVSEFLVDLFKVTDPGQARGQSVTAREILDRGAKQIERQLADQPEVQGRLMNTMGRVFQNLGLYDEALPLLERGLEVRRGALGDDHEDVSRSLNSLGWLYETRGDFKSAESMYREALAIQRRLPGETHEQVATTLNNLGLVLYRQDAFVEAESVLRESLAIRRTLGSDRSAKASDTLNNLGLLLHALERFDEAEVAYRDSLEMRREILGPDHPHVAVSLDNLGRLAYSRKDVETAERYFRQALDLRKRVLGDEHPEYSQSLNNLGSVYYRQKDYAKAVPIFEEAVAIDRRKLGDRHPGLGITLGNLATVMQAAGDAAGAEPLYREVLSILEGALESTHQNVARAHGNLGGCLTAQKRYAEAEPHLLKCYAIVIEKFPPDHRRVRSAAAKLADLYEAWGRPADAQRYRAAADSPDGD